MKHSRVPGFCGCGRSPAAATLKSSNISLTSASYQAVWLPDDLLENLLDDVVFSPSFSKDLSRHTWSQRIGTKFLPLDNKRGKEKTCFFSIAFISSCGIKSLSFLVDLERNSICCVLVKTAEPSLSQDGANKIPAYCAKRIKIQINLVL